MRLDKSWRVRFVVAESLSATPDRAAAVAARELLDDPSSSVQLRVLNSVAQWPPAEAAPIFWEAMGKNTYLTRQTASRQLAALWPEAASFPVEGSPRHRAEFLDGRLAEFRQRFAAPPGDLVSEVVQAAHSTVAAPTAEQIAEARHWLRALSEGEANPRQAGREGLLGMGPPAIDALETLVVQEHGVLPDEVWGEVLPRLSSAFADLERLRSADVATRRRGAERLAQRREQPLVRLAVLRLASLMEKEADELVWRSVFRAVAADASEPSMRLAYIALGHASPEVRRQACEHLAAHPSARHAAALIPALKDPQPSVVFAAVRAVGLTGRAEAAEAIKSLLRSPNDALRLEAATALCVSTIPPGRQRWTGWRIAATR